ncbi:MAG: glycosyltransferase [Saccharofermentans sp.]|nr:glycosyltransferase [Saccharofermentans sp.]
MSRLVLKICGSVWKNANRDKREMAVYRELGERVLILVKGENSDKGRKDEVDGFEVHRYSTKPLGNGAPKFFNQILSLFVWAKYARSLHPDVISGHDLPGLTIGWISTWFQKRKPLLIYDSHEFEIGRNAKRNRFQRWFVRNYEKYMMKKCTLSIMVNDIIADEVTRIHKLKTRPIVVRSTPDNWEIDERVCIKVREGLFGQFHANGCEMCDGKEKFLIMYHGILTTDRGIEALIEVVSVNPNLCGIILGNGREEYVKTIREMVVHNNVEDRILFHEAVDISELWKYVGAADLSLMMIQGNNKSYYYSLPNKFFESIQSLTPIVASDFPEMKKIIDKYEIGLTCSSKNIRDINDCVEKMRIDTAFYDRCRKNIIKAKEELCWENEKQVLIKAYRNMF